MRVGGHSSSRSTLRLLQVAITWSGRRVVLGRPTIAVTGMAREAAGRCSSTANTLQQAEYLVTCDEMQRPGGAVISQIPAQPPSPSTLQRAVVRECGGMFWQTPGVPQPYSRILHRDTSDDRLA